MQPIHEVQLESNKALSIGLLETKQPFIIRGYAKNWDIVQHAQTAKDQHHATDKYLRDLYKGLPITCFSGDSDIGGRFGYTHDYRQLNFKSKKEDLADVLDCIETQRNKPQASSYYIGSVDVERCLPGFSEKNSIDLSGLTNDPNLLTSVWIGNKTQTAAHYDTPENIACVASGTRRFTLFPPNQIHNLYPGPLDPTPAGQVISCVDIANPDYERFPNYRMAEKEGLSAELSPGDIIYIPSMWWHNVEALESLNVLINYWWNNSAKHLGQGITALHAALLSLKELPPEQKSAWKHILDYYIFSDDDNSAHIPPESLGLLGSIDINAGRKLRAMINARVNR